MFSTRISPFAIKLLVLAFILVITVAVVQPKIAASASRTTQSVSVEQYFVFGEDADDDTTKE